MVHHHITRPSMGRQLSSVVQPPPPHKKGGLSSLPGGRPALFAFALSLLAYTLQSELAQYVQQGLGYRKPFLSLYLGHSGFTILLPLHLLFLRYSTAMPYSHFFHIIAQNLHWQLSTPTQKVQGQVQADIRRRLSTYSGRHARGGQPGSSSAYHDGDDPERHRQQQQTQPTSASGRPSIPPSIPARDSLPSSHPHFASSMPTPPPYTTWAQRTMGFDLPKFILMLLTLMGALTVPALSWYCAVPMTSMADITALYNTFSVWALVFTVWFFGEKWSRYKVASVLLACGGVIIVAYGGGEESEHRRRPKEPDPVYGKPSATLSLSASQVRSVSTDSDGNQQNSTPEATEDYLASVGARSTAAPSLAIEVEFLSVTTSVASRKGRAEPAASNAPPPTTSNPLLGDMLALFGAITMAAYEMAFKLLGTLPDEDAQKKRWNRAQSGSSRKARGDGSATGRRSRVHQIAREDLGEEEAALLLADGDVEAEHEDRPTQHRQERSNHILGTSDEEEGDADETLLGPSARSSIPPRPSQSTERSAIWTPPQVAGGFASSPSGADLARAGGYGSGASSPFLAVDGSLTDVERAIGTDASRKAGELDDPLSVKAVESRLQATPRKKPVRRNRTREGNDDFCSGNESTGTDMETETESVLQSGDEEEMLAGGTRLGRNRPASKDMGDRKSLGGAGRAGARGSVVYPNRQELPYDDDNDEDEDEDEAEDGNGRESQDQQLDQSSRRREGPTLRLLPRAATVDATWIPPPLPFGLHANIMTSGIGLVTASTLWLGVLIAHITGWEPFELPQNWLTLLTLSLVVLSGILFNGCFMLLLALWGPVTASVSCLLSTVAVAIFDALLKGAFSITSIVGCAFIVGGFALLVSEPSTHQ